MIAALIIGRKGSVEFPGKNLYPVIGRPPALYPMMAAASSRFIDADVEGAIRRAVDYVRQIYF